MTILKSNRFLIFLLLVIAVLRLPLLFEGLPAVYNSTEYFMAKIALGMGSRVSLDPLIYIYPKFFAYVLLAIFLFIFVAGYIIGFFNGAHDYAVQFLTDPTWFYFSGRLASLVFSLLTIIFIYHYIHKYRDETHARIAALLAGFSINFFEFSAYATQESLLIFISGLATIFILRLQSKSGSSEYLIAGLLCGLAVGVKYNAGFIFLGVLVVYIQNMKQNKHTIWLALAGAVSGFIMVNPYWILKFSDFYQGFLLISDQMYSAVSTNRGINYIWEITTLIKTELVIGVLFLAATIWAFKSDFKKYLPFLVIIIVTLAYVGSWNKKGIDYIFPIFPAWIILSSDFISNILNRFKPKRNITLILYTIIFFPAMIFMLYHVSLVLKNDTRETATDWIIANVSAQECICYDNHHYDLGIFDVDRFISYGAGARQLPDAIKDKLESYRNDDRNMHMVHINFGDTTKILSGSNLYEAEQAKYKRKDLDRIIREGVDYLVIRDDFYQMYEQVRNEHYPPVVSARIDAANNFYHKLFLNYKPTVVFSPGFWIKGPKVSIYKLSGE